MRTDRELLELAAKAAGITWTREYKDGPMKVMQPFSREWDPLTDDGDALRLAAKLPLSINICPSYVTVYGDFSEQDFLVDECLRRAIVRAAAEIGAAM